MRLFAAVLLVILLVTPVSADQNPGIMVLLSTVYPYGGFQIDPPEPDTIVDVYVILSCFDYEGGTRGVGVLFSRDPSLVMEVVEVTNFLGGYTFGAPEDPDEGLAFVAGSDCEYPYDDLVVAGSVSYRYISGTGGIHIDPNPISGRQVLDCNNLSDDYCIGWGIGIGVEPPFYEPNCSSCFHWDTWVRCEPQGGENPTHVETYWYDVTAGMGSWVYFAGFSVQVFDPDITNYTNWVTPDGWESPDSIQHIGDEMWISWCDPDFIGGNGPGSFRFMFENPNPPSWGHWTMTWPDTQCSAFGAVQHSSHEFAGWEDGYGYRVHVPAAGTATRDATWGTIKALYR